MRLFLSLLAASYVLGQDLSRSILERKLISRQSPAPAFKTFSFNQITNHFPNDTFYGPPPTSATFPQNYILNDTFYRPGGPIFLLDSGETSASSRGSFLLTGVIAELAQATGGMGIIIEHRYYGTTFPELELIAAEGLTTDNLRWLTTEQSIADFAYFAQHVSVPGHEDEDLTAPGRPWIMYGGSLAGAETAFTVKEFGDVIYGGISSSGTVKVFTGYPQWYYTIQENAPQDCVQSIEDIVDKMDFLITTKNTAALAELKTIFGLEAVQDIRDVALTIAFPIGNPFTYPTNSWQELNWDPNVGGDDFFLFCDAVTSANKTFSAVDSQLSKFTGGAVWTNLGNYANYIKTKIIPFCPPGVSLDSNECFGTHNATAWADPNDFSGNRAYLYQSCLEAGQFSQGAPLGRRTLLSRSIQTDYSERWCKWGFPAGKFNTVPATPALERWNKYGALHIQADRLAQVDGGIDPWQYACVHSPDGFPREDTLLRPYYLIKQGGHHWDENGLLNISAEPDFIQAIHDYEIKFVKSWLADFPKWRANQTQTRSS
ncbi:extracelular serine carboxypeptidase-like protein [Roridomyces roridus]|uniref:Extracelular serine carboxypeptidase-like protein n=1 Tax=Roridomyces roridus TaxID=1738132 RepID=A0AAD7AYL1_9AGAR|nr:extracelular serine carboxypeptidase-like protein [Roridomyces roridus]